jgi:hypothetical protein
MPFESRTCPACAEPHLELPHSNRMAIHFTEKGRRCDGRTAEELAKAAREVAWALEAAARRAEAEKKQRVIDERRAAKRVKQDGLSRKTEPIRQTKNSATRETYAELEVAFAVAARKKRGRIDPDSASKPFDRSIYHVKGMGTRGVQGGAPGSGKR